MTLPRSFYTDGFGPEPKPKYKHVLIGTDGPANSGKTEFSLSAPGPGIVICLDRGFDAMLDNQRPPPTRQTDFAFKVIKVPLATQAAQPVYVEYWREFYKEYKAALNNVDARTVVLDGDSDSWELQRLAEFGKLTQIPSILYTGVNTARRAMIARAWDSGKIVIATNKIKKQYRTKYKPDGTPMLQDSGKEVREWDGVTFDRQGFEDQEYLWNLQLRHLYKPASFNRVTKKNYPEQWGIRIIMCKVDRSLEGQELWGADCCMPILLQTVYPNVSLEEWGYK